MCQRVDIEKIREDLPVCNEQQAEALREYLAEEEARRKADELLAQRLSGIFERKCDFSI